MDLGWGRSEKYYGQRRLGWNPLCEQLQAGPGSGYLKNTF
jgi:hypothetical protein